MSLKQGITEKERKFLAKWKEQRKSKMHIAKYVAVHCLFQGLFQGLFTGIVSYLFIIRFDLAKFNAVDFWIQIVVFTVGGGLYGYWAYRARDRRFKQVYPDNQ